MVWIAVRSRRRNPAICLAFAPSTEAAKNAQFFCFLPFDRHKPAAYTPRPRRSQGPVFGQALWMVFRLWQNENSRLQAAFFDIVI
jgi:hypothetical protein